ncbi:gamma-glutamyltransferase [Aquella oligotrophica]|uniref:Glutathione hydrolase proenzyme n=1 Tax=Aquella oligotrophica TaxID=2067065 RepID=A0A2I7N462_9NEIS|nr:gamma-glutamyltransferase [Aquella oligotrophica]AUR51260.1 gamma-glutamyltransferase [Aquella oligotrophica]
MNRNTTIKKSVLGVLVATSFFSNAYAANQPVAPEVATAKTDKELVLGKKSMVVTNNPWASQAASEILGKGGNATDAAIAAAFMLGLTEPQSSGIGGGGYAMVYNDKKMKAYDGREVAPRSANPQWFIGSDGKPLSFDQAMLSAKSIGVPSEVALLYKMHQDSGKLDWKKLLEPAIKLAQKGFPMSPRLYNLLVADQNVLSANPAITAVYFNSDGSVKAIGTTVKNPDYATTLQKIAKDPQEFYTGSIAKDIINIINEKAGTELYTKKDLKDYNVIVYDPVCSLYRNQYKICSVPPSSSGGATVLELMQIYANNYSGNNPQDVKWAYNFLEASKLAYADRNQYLADPDFVKQPVKGLLNTDYLASRSKLVSESALATPVSAGIPDGIDKKYAPDLSPKPHGTTSMSIVDKNGDAVTMTVTVEHQFGSHLFVDGFFLNNELTDFSFKPVSDNGKPIANRVEAGKRPRSSIAPTMVFDKKGKLYALTGSPGGSQIICYVAKNLIGMLDMGLTPLDAVSSANLCAVNTNPVIESGNDWLNQQIPQLQAMGESIVQSDLVSGETNILKTKNGWLGAADPRREGVAIGN